MSWIILGASILFLYFLAIALPAFGINFFLVRWWQERELAKLTASN